MCFICICNINLVVSCEDVLKHSGLCTSGHILRPFMCLFQKSLREIRNATDTSRPFEYKQSVAPGFLDFFLDQASKSDQDTSQCPFPQLCPGRKCRPLLRSHLQENIRFSNSGILTLLCVRRFISSRQEVCAGSIV